MKVAARAGSQICSTPSQVSRPSLTRMSTTSQRSVKPRSSMVIPASFLIVLLAPSQPSTTWPVNVCVSPPKRACTRTGPVGFAVTGPTVPSSLVTSAPRRNSISGCRSIRASSSSSRSGWWNMLACGKPCWLAWWSRLNSAITRWLASSRRSPLPGRDRARNRSLMPIRSRVRATSSSRCTARGRGWGWVWRSRRVTGIPKSASRRAAVQPAGPAPTAMTGSWVARFWSFTGVSLLGRSVRGGLGGGRGPGADGEGEPADGVSDPAGVRAGHGDDQPPVLVRSGGPGVGQARRGQGVGHGAGSGVGGQRGFEVLAHLGDRDGVDRVDVLGPGGGLADGGAGPGEQFGLVEPARGGRDDVGHRDLAGVAVGASDGRGGADGGVPQQRFLDRPGVDVVAAADNEVLGPAGEVHEAVGVDAAEVAGVQPAGTDGAVLADPRAAEAGVGDVAGEYGGPADG